MSEKWWKETGAILFDWVSLSLFFVHLVFSAGVESKFAWDIWRPLSSKDLLPEAFVYRKLMPDIFCHQEPQIQIKCLKSAKFLPRGAFFHHLFMIDLVICLSFRPAVFLPSKRWYTKCRTSELAKGRATATPPTSNHTTKRSCVIFCSPGSCWFFGLIRFKLESNRLISSKESQLKHQVDTLALACAFCYGIVIPCCLLYLYGKQHMVLEVNRTRTVARWHWRWGCSFDFFQQKSVPCDFSPMPRLMLGTRAICTCGSMTFSAPRAKRYQGRTTSSCALWLQQHRHTSPCSIVDRCLGRASHHFSRWNLCECWLCTKPPVDNSPVWRPCVGIRITFETPKTVNSGVG